MILHRLAEWLLPIPVGWIITLRWQATSGTRLFGGGVPGRRAVTGRVGE